jgi:hypothetical protein
MLNISEKDYLYITMFIMLGLFLSVYYMIIAEPYLYHMFFARSVYHGIIPVTFLYLLAFLSVWWRYDLISNHISLPSVLFLSFMGYYIYLGTIDQCLQVSFNAVFTYNESITSGYNYVSLALSCWIAGYLLGGNVIGKISLHGAFKKVLSPRRVRIWDQRRLYLVNLFWGVIGLISFVVFYAFYVKGLPFLQGVSPNANVELRSLVMTKAHNIHVIAFNAMTIALIYSGVYLALYKRNVVMIMVFIWATTAFLLWGARIYIAIPFLIFFPFMARIKRYPLKKVAGVLVIVVVAGLVYGQFRNRNFFGEYIDFSDRTIIERLADLHMG